MTKAVGSFDELRDADLDQVYQQGREEVLRDHAFRILLARADTVAKLEALAFGGEHGLRGWTTKELIEISNHFRLLSSPENEVRLYRECQDEIFRRVPRVREFYVLALNKLKRPAEAIQEIARITAEGEQHALLWGTLGESYSARMFFAEQLLAALAKANGDLNDLSPDLRVAFPGYFPEVEFATLTSATVKVLREKSLRQALHMFQRGFRESGTSFTGLGWLLRSLDQLTDLTLEKYNLEQLAGSRRLDSHELFRLHYATAEIQTLQNSIEGQKALIRIALTLQGGEESLDYWTNAGALLLAVIEGKEEAALAPLLDHLFATVDADFKLSITLAELRRICTLYLTTQKLSAGSADKTLAPQIASAAFAMDHCKAARIRFKTTGSARMRPEERLASGFATESSTSALRIFLQKTINFRALTGNLVPLFISGGLGRVGARVPDLVINRKVQADLADIIESKVLPALVAEERNDPRAVSRRILQVVGAGLRLADLQDLTSPAHAVFDIRSDGLIALSGIDRDMRKHTRTATDLTATLFMQTGDCRETMYLNGALFACWQQMRVKQLMVQALHALEMDFTVGFQQIVEHEIPTLLRYQLRGGQVAIYVDSMAMESKYRSVRVADDDPTGVLRQYGVTEWRAGEPLSCYELENSKLKVQYADGTVHWHETIDPATGRWRPLLHTPTAGGGVPILPEFSPNGAPISDIRLITLVEDHAMTFLYDSHEHTVEFRDGFYNESMFASPYTFGSGQVVLAELATPPGLLRAGSRPLLHPDRTLHPHTVYLQFLPFSQTEYEAALIEGDIPGTIQLMGRVFLGELKRERRRLEEGDSPIPPLLEAVHAWQLQQQATIQPNNRKQIELQLARLLLDLARTQPELVQLKVAQASEPLIREAEENSSIFLVVSGRLHIYRHQEHLRDHNGEPISVGAGGILGEISALRGGVASATVAGNAVVLHIESSVIQRQLADDSAFRRIMETMAGYRVP